MPTYDPKKVLVSLGGLNIHGFSEDSIITISPMGDGITSVVGCDGQVVRTLSPDRRHEVTIPLQQSSSSNDELSIIHARDRSKGDGILPLLVKDLSGRTTFFASQAWITKHPEVNRTNDASGGNTEWVLNTADGTLFVGGHD
jgi:hypothetical protein